MSRNLEPDISVVTPAALLQRVQDRNLAWSRPSASYPCSGSGYVLCTLSAKLIIFSL